MKKQHCRQAAFAAVSVLVALVAQSASAQLATNKATDLRAQNDEASRLIRQLPNKTKVEALERAVGLWRRVKVDSDIGYVKFMHIGGGATVVQSESTSGGSVMGDFNRFLGGGSSGARKNEVATVGIRGLDEQSLKDAEPNLAALAAMKRFEASDSDARRVASQGNVRATSVAYIAGDASDAATAAAAGAKK